jgi:hypothetical protein
VVVAGAAVVEEVAGAVVVVSSELEEQPSRSPEIPTPAVVATIVLRANLFMT